MAVEIHRNHAGSPLHRVPRRELTSRSPAVSDPPQTFAQVLQQAQSPVDPRLSSSRGRFPLLPLRDRSSITPGVPQPRQATPLQPSKSLGTLSARFEAGPHGVAAIGYDANGGTSYGTYQISSRTGTMERFLAYLEARMPAWAQRLRAAGPANTGSRQGAMPEAWQTIAAEAPERFAQLQHDFIAETHYLPAVQAITQRTGVAIAQVPKALQEVLWSTAVQHGPTGAANIFCKAIEATGPPKGTPLIRDLIATVYTTRASQFGRSSAEIRAAVQRRFQEEAESAVAMLRAREPSPDNVRFATAAPRSRSV